LGRNLKKQIQFILRTVKKHKSCTEISSSSRTGLGPDQIDGPGPLPDPSQSISKGHFSISSH
jgi:hypothetical protein